MPGSELRECKKCGAVKALHDFYRHPKGLQGFASKCKECAKAAIRANRALKVEQYRAYDRARDRRGSSQDTSKYRQNNPKKYRAHVSLNNAVRDGKLVKPSECSKCGKTGPVVGHHDDYDKPLTVRWLCQACHVQWHKENGEGLNAQ